MATDTNVYEDIIQHSEEKNLEVYEDVIINDPEKPREDNEVLLPIRRKKTKRKTGYSFFTFPSGASLKRYVPTAGEHKMSEQFGKGEDKHKVGEMVFKKFTKLKKHVEKFTSKDKDNKSDKPSSLSEFLRPRPSEIAVPNEYQTDILRPKLPDRNKAKELTRRSRSESDINKLIDNHNAALEHKQEETTVSQGNVSNIGCPPVLANSMPVKADAKSNSENDYLMPVPRQSGIYRTFLQKQKEIKSQQTGESKDKQCAKSIDKNETVESDNDRKQVYGDLGFPTVPDKELLLKDGVENKRKSPTSKTGVTNKSFNESSGPNPHENEEAAEVEDTSEYKNVGNGEVGLKRLKMKEVKQVLADLSLEKYADKFEENRIDGLILSTLTLKDFTDELELTKLEAVRICEFIKSGHVPK